MGRGQAVALPKFRQSRQRVADSLRELLIGLRRAGVAWRLTHSAKGSTLLNYLALPAGTLEFVVAIPVPSSRVGYTPGTHLPI